jgi:phospholipase/carboxylesterase
MESRAYAIALFIPVSTLATLGCTCSRTDKGRDEHYASLPMEPSPSFVSQRRSGPRPDTTSTNPHTQLTQNAPRELQERVLDFARSLTGVVVGPSLVSVPGARAFHLPAESPKARDCFMVDHEFAHLHPPSDGSLHMSLPSTIVDAVIASGWAERHPLAGKHGLPNNIVMVFGPRDENELAVVKDLIRASYELATGKA